MQGQQMQYMNQSQQNQMMYQQQQGMMRNPNAMFTRNTSVRPGINSQMTLQQLRRLEPILQSKMPAGWTVSKTLDGRVYFKDHANKRTQWECPIAIDPSWAEEADDKAASKPQDEGLLATLGFGGDEEDNMAGSKATMMALRGLGFDDDDILPVFEEEGRCKLTADQKAFMIRLFTIVFEMYKLTMACLLTIFVPRHCIPGTYQGVPKTEPHECTLEDSTYFPDLAGYERFVLFWNFLTLGISVVHYMLVYYREKFLVFTLDYNPELPDNALPAEVGKYPIVKDNLQSWNKKLFYSSVINVTALIVNVVISAYLIFGYDDAKYYKETKTATVFATNVVLVLIVYKNALQNGYSGFYKMRAFSCVDFIPFSFNTVDPLWIKRNKDKGIVTTVIASKPIDDDF